MAELSYRAAVSVLERALVFGVNPSLDGITELCEALGRPQDSFSVVQVAGTNGKTSTARLIHELLLAEGVRSALYTSPELQRINERMQIGAGPIGDRDFARAISAAVDAAEGLRPNAQGTGGGFTEFELTTAAALWLFRECGAEMAVLEVGMGGRWDATSVASADVAVITGIGLDHVHILGDSLEAIAAEKAAIICPGSTVVLGPGTEGLHDLFLRRVDEVGASVRVILSAEGPSPVPEEMTARFGVLATPSSPGGRTRVGVGGLFGDYLDVELAAPAYQAGNIATAIAAAEAVLGHGLDADRVRSAFDRVTLPGRFELVSPSPPVILDGAHNPQAAAVLAGAIADAWPDLERRPMLLLGVLADKDAAGIVAALSPVVAEIRVSAPLSGRAMSADQLAVVVEEVTGRRPVVVESLSEAVRAAVSAAHDGLVVAGSLITAGQARSVLLDDSATP